MRLHRSTGRVGRHDRSSPCHASRGVRHDLHSQRSGTAADIMAVTCTQGVSDRLQHICTRDGPSELTIYVLWHDSCCTSTVLVHARSFTVNLLHDVAPAT